MSQPNFSRAYNGRTCSDEIVNEQFENEQSERLEAERIYWKRREQERLAGRVEIEDNRKKRLLSFYSGIADHISGFL